MFRRRAANSISPTPPAPMDRVTSVLGPGTSLNGRLTGSGGVRIEGAFEGEITLRGLLVVGENGRVTCDHIQAHIVVIAGVVKGDISAEKVEIRSTGRVWGNVVTASFSTEEGAFLRGQITMEEELDIELLDLPEGELELAEAEAAEATSPEAESEVIPEDNLEESVGE